MSGNLQFEHAQLKLKGYQACTLALSYVIRGRTWQNDWVEHKAMFFFPLRDNNAHIIGLQ